MLIMQCKTKHTFVWAGTLFCVFSVAVSTFGAALVNGIFGSGRDVVSSGLSIFSSAPRNICRDELRTSTQIPTLSDNSKGDTDRARLFQTSLSSRIQHRSSCSLSVMKDFKVDFQADWQFFLYHYPEHSQWPFDLQVQSLMLMRFFPLSTATCYIFHFKIHITTINKEGRLPTADPWPEVGWSPLSPFHIQIFQRCCGYSPFPPLPALLPSVRFSLSSHSCTVLLRSLMSSTLSHPTAFFQRWSSCNQTS